MNGHSMPVANGSASAAGNDVLTNQLAGMSKHQLYEVMLQMKVYTFLCDLKCLSMFFVIPYG